MAGMNWRDEEKHAPGLKHFLFLVAGIIFMIVLLGCFGAVKSETGQYKREGSDFHTLFAAPRVLVEPEEQIALIDGSTYAEDESLALCQYTNYYYNEDLLIAEADYDKAGSLINWREWEYDAAGNLIRERTKNGTDGLQTRRYIYEYDDAGNVVHQKVYWDERVVEDNYFRYTDIGRAGISYSYLNDGVDGGISDYCYERKEFLEDEDGRPLCTFCLNSIEVDTPKNASKMQWVQQGNYLVNRVQFYEYGIEDPSRRDWYQDAGAADREQYNLFEYDPGTKSRNHVLQINYNWQENRQEFCLVPSFYRARYDGDQLLWQMEYTDGVLTYYTVCQYDTDGRLLTGVEYGAEEEGPYAVFYRFAYPQWNRTERYSYDIQGQEFVQAFGEGERASLTFSNTGILSGIEMTDAAGNVSEKYEFGKSGESAGGLERMYVGSDVLTGERAVLGKLEAEAEAYGFRAGEDLESNTEGSAE